MHSHVAGDLYQLGACVPGENGHEAVRVYVLENAGQPVLIDCGSHLHRPEFMAGLEALLKGVPPAYVFLTHSELPHVGNLQRVAQRWPAVQVIVSNVMLPYIEIPPVLPLSQVTAVRPGTVLDVGGRKLVFLTALLRDQPGSQWIYDTLTRALFTGDAFGYYHAAGECEAFSDQLPQDISTARFLRYHQNAFRFLRWTQPARLNADLARLFHARPIDIICPTHGNALRTNISAHLHNLQSALSSARTALQSIGQPA